jgi:hypothetical protein
MTSFFHLLARPFRRFADCGQEDYAQAAIEVFIICVSAFLPLWAGIGFFAMTQLKGSVQTYSNSFMTSGEMFLIACGLIGPLIYIITRKYGRFNDPLTLRFPDSTGFSVFIVLIWFISGCVFVSNKAGEVFKTDVFDDAAIWDLSLAITVVAIAVLYFATAFRNSMDRVDAGRIMHDDQESFVRDFGNAEPH